ncbi:hypothetical protein [Thermosynechococcus sp. OHK43]
MLCFPRGRKSIGCSICPLPVVIVEDW